MAGRLPGQRSRRRPRRVPRLLGSLYVRLLLTRQPIDDILTEHLVDLILAGIATPGTGRP
jgi:hypothetical protein